MAYQNIVGAKLAQATLGITIYAVIYRVPADTRAYVKNIDVCNTTVAAITVDISLVPPGGTAGVTNALYFTQSIAAYGVLQWRGLAIMNAADTIQVRASATGCAIYISGGEAT